MILAIASHSVHLSLRWGRFLRFVTWLIILVRKWRRGNISNIHDIFFVVVCRSKYDRQTFLCVCRVVGRRRIREGEKRHKCQKPHYHDDWLRSRLQGLPDLLGIFCDHLMMAIPLSGLVRQQEQELSWSIMELATQNHLLQRSFRCLEGKVFKFLSLKLLGSEEPRHAVLLLKLLATRAVISVQRQQRARRIHGGNTG